ncbi:PadR family transcriptional regulator [Methanolobus zinderi]|jgi:DNA-binding MarR family transcriptional regulator|uniref:PadR family transcriptional regulator n=1 Tax=Methanolobus zinderi TaxID=536044 RepID=A0A7D5IBI9_9EURY|nr:PadR family transcriptional regulator [Methanolobus zinderi]QLC49849.1 PadR family transcriptional regulator [Methanolobus zinderi]
MTKEYAEQLFLQEKPVLALLAIWSFQKTYASVITKEINSTFAHTTKILSKMEDHGLVQFSVEGRVKYVELTEHGYKVVDALKDLIIALEGEMSESLEEAEAENDPSADIDSDTIHDRIERLYTSISSIYNEVQNNGSDFASVQRKIGPFSRDIQLLISAIEQSEDDIDDDSLDKLSEMQDMFDSVMKQKVKTG